MSSVRPRVGALLTPVADWAAIAEAADVADELGFDAIGFWDHYHSAQPDWGYVCGWSAYGAVAAVTRRVRLVPMVLNNLHYEVGVLAKESSVLANASAGRFELAIGAGDWPESFAAWGAPFPNAAERLDRLEESVLALRRLWTGEPVTTSGRFVRLDGAICAPPPSVPPRVVVGVGKSLRTLRRAVGFADELNVYDDPTVVDEARRLIADSGRPVDLSLFVDWSWTSWPSDPGTELERLAARGFDRVFVSLGGADMPDRLREITPPAAGNVGRSAPA
jgi:alkanesulfonate monooxygenase SsuD/methylene tetrahydromethanopterin reductase-like flavin-dependent oxidoreductase (luciferase family)